MSKPTHYTTLGVAPSATSAQIKRAYRDLAKAHHPDINKSSDAAKRFAAIANAYEVLGDAAKRRDYDRSLLNAANSSPQQGSTDTRAHYTWTNIAAHGASQAARANREEEIDELYDTFFRPPTPARTPPKARSAPASSPDSKPGTARKPAPKRSRS